MKNAVVIKLGGSLITDKSTPYTVRPDMIERVVDQIAQAAKNPALGSILIGNGAGSFAHQSAKKFNTIVGFHDDAGRLGACITHADAVALNQIVVQSCVAHGLPAYGLQPSALMTSADGIPHQLQFGILDTLLSQSLIPSFYGDVIIDVKRGSTIYSTDKLCALFARFLVSHHYHVRVIHVGDYDGVLDSNHELIPLITPGSSARIALSVGSSAHTDVTGGMKTKLEELIQLAREDIPSIILNGTRPHLLFEALMGHHVEGTYILPDTHPVPKTQLK